MCLLSYMGCAGEDSNLRRPKPTGLQPVVIDHSTTDAFGYYSYNLLIFQLSALPSASLVSEGLCHQRNAPG